MLSWREKLTPTERKCAVYTTETKKEKCIRIFVVGTLKHEALGFRETSIDTAFPRIFFFLHVIAPP